MKIAITGASGFIGSRLASELRARGDEVIAIGRREPPDFSEADGVVNLAGEPVAQRWTADAKARIRSSRVEGTKALAEAITHCDPGPRVLVSASAAGYYGDRGSEELDESSRPGDDFLASLCVDWEAAADAAAVRVVKVRTGVVLGREGGALKKMLPPFRAGLGGPIAGGRQYMPWISLEDIVGIYLAALSDDSWSGPVNGSAPSPATNAEFTRALGRKLKRPTVLPIPALALKALYGEMASTVTGSQRMVPRRALELGYDFRHATLDDALRSALQ
jgi:uncharacterized protein (TIGR01777 family)